MSSKDEFIYDEHGKQIGIKLKGTGRKPWIPPDPAIVEGLARRGLTMEQIAHALDIHPATLYKKKAVFAEFAEAVKRGQAKGVSSVAAKLYDDALGGNVVAEIFYLKARGDWRDQHLQLSGDPDPRLVEYDQMRTEIIRLLRAMTQDERDLYVELLARARRRINGEEAMPEARGALPAAIAHLEVEDVDPDGKEAGAGDDGTPEIV